MSTVSCGFPPETDCLVFCVSAQSEEAEFSPDKRTVSSPKKMSSRHGRKARVAEEEPKRERQQRDRRRTDFFASASIRAKEAQKVARAAARVSESEDEDAPKHERGRQGDESSSGSESEDDNDRDVEVVEGELLFEAQDVRDEAWYDIEVLSVSQKQVKVGTC